MLVCKQAMHAPLCVWIQELCHGCKHVITSVYSPASRAQGVVSELQMSFCSQASCLHLPASELFSLLFDENYIA